MSHIERIRTLLESKGMIPDVKENGTELVLMISTGPVSSRMVITEPKKGVVGCSILMPIFCPQGRRTEIATAICKANWGLIGGSFRMDQRDGEVRYECFLPTHDAGPTDGQLTWLIHGSWTVASRYAMAFMEIAVSSVNPEEAINKVETAWQEEGSENIGILQ